MAPNTPGAKIPRWRTRIKGAWLIKIGNNLVYTINDAQWAFHTLSTNGATTVMLLCLRSKIQPAISHDGLPIVSSIPFHQHIHDQKDHQWDFTIVAEHLRKAPPYSNVINGDVQSCVTKMMKLTRRKLLRQDDWSNW
jgi:hypothetical protein